MAQLLFSLPKGTTLDQFTALRLQHPKGQTVTFLLREKTLYELSHRRVETNACFVTAGDKTIIQHPKVIQTHEFDLLYLLLPVLEQQRERGKIAPADLELPVELGPLIGALGEPWWGRVCETAKSGDDLYIRLDHEKLNSELEQRHAKLLEKMDTLNVMTDYTKETKRYHAAKAICDCLTKQHEKSFLAHLKIENQVVEDAPPPAKKPKKTVDAPTEDYSEGKENVVVTAVDAKKAAHEKKLKSAAKGTRSIAGFFTPKKK